MQPATRPTRKVPPARARTTTPVSDKAASQPADESLPLHSELPTARTGKRGRASEVDEDGNGYSALPKKQRLERATPPKHPPNPKKVGPPVFDATDDEVALSPRYRLKAKRSRPSREPKRKSKARQANGGEVLQQNLVGGKHAEEVHEISQTYKETQKQHQEPTPPEDQHSSPARETHAGAKPTRFDKILASAFPERPKTKLKKTHFPEPDSGDHTPDFIKRTKPSARMLPASPSPLPLLPQLKAAQPLPPPSPQPDPPDSPEGEEGDDEGEGGDKDGEPEGEEKEEDPEDKDVSKQDVDGEEDDEEEGPSFQIPANPQPALHHPSGEHAAILEFHAQRANEGASDFSDDHGDERLRLLNVHLADSSRDQKKYLDCLTGLTKLQTRLTKHQADNEKGYLPVINSIAAAFRAKELSNGGQTILGQLNKALGKIQELRTSDERIKQELRLLARRHAAEAEKQRRCATTIVKLFEDMNYKGSNAKRINISDERLRRAEERAERRTREFFSGIRQRHQEMGVRTQKRKRKAPRASNTSPTSSARKLRVSTAMSTAITPDSSAGFELIEDITTLAEKGSESQSRLSREREGFSRMSIDSADVELVVVEGFGQRVRKLTSVSRGGSEDLDVLVDMKWSNKESDVVVKGLERFTGPNRWAEIRQCYEELLGRRSEEAIRDRAREIRTILENDGSMYMEHWWFGF